MTAGILVSVPTLVSFATLANKLSAKNPSNKLLVHCIEKESTYFCSAYKPCTPCNSINSNATNYFSLHLKASILLSQAVRTASWGVRQSLFPCLAAWIHAFGHPKGKSQRWFPLIQACFALTSLSLHLCFTPQLSLSSSPPLFCFP